MTTRLTNTFQELARLNDLLHLLSDDLQELLDQPLDEENARWMAAVIDNMLENLQKQFDLEEGSAYMQDVLEQFPTWHPQVEHLQQEHRLLHRQLAEVRRRVARRTTADTVSREVRRQLSDWIQAYRGHQKRENQLVQDAFTLELGVGD